MFTINFNDKTTLYEQLYHRIRTDIESGFLGQNEKLPSKRKLAKHLQISISTVQNAYEQLLAEGYIISKEKKGYYVCDEPVFAGRKIIIPPPLVITEPQAESPQFDLKTNAVDTEHFPYSVWSRLMRESMRENPTVLLHSLHPQGNYDLRVEIANYLQAFRDVNITPEQIILGAGIEYIIGLITELLPVAFFAYENPGYMKIRKILESRRMDAVAVPVDNNGLIVEKLAQTGATAVFVTASNHFPTGAVMGVGRRRQLIEWAEQSDERYIIEDDFNSEFRFVLKPIPALQSLDTSEKVIYINSFAQTLAPSLRMAYAVLPETLLQRYREKLMFYSCTVSQFEQLTLKRFLQGGYYERHLGRMKTVYRNRQKIFIDGLSPIIENLILDGQKAGLHLQIKSAKLTECELVKLANDKGVRVYPFSDFYAVPPPETHTVALGFAGCGDDELREVAGRLCAAWE
ncbi:MAG: PLP-dependent aminotransferase family protein [Lachnospiraceae bacterium]|nr:PLP-dependent aminotransferase family protein [Lachnospiraceae bacterium]